MEQLSSLKDMRAEFERLQLVEDQIDVELGEMLKESGKIWLDLTKWDTRS